MKQRLADYLNNEAEITVLERDIARKPIHVISRIIKNDWKKVFFGAAPYLEAMDCINDISDSFGADSGKSVVSYFLANANTYRGEKARIIKAELRRRLKVS